MDTRNTMTMEVFDRYLDIMNRLWNLNQLMMRRNMEYTLWSQHHEEKPAYDDLPF